MANLKNTEIDNNLELPSGTTAQRPSSPQEGQIRYNTDLSVTEFYNGSNWRPLSDTNPEATGGTVVDTDIGGVPYRIHLFTETGTDTFTVTNPGEVEYLIVAGGGGSGSYGGGGGGGLITGVFNVGIQSYDIIVGDGGTGSDTTRGESGTDSSAFGLTAVGGGGGGGDSISSGGSGGSGGGGNRFGGAGGSGTAGQGSPGGNTSDENGIGSGGGGAGEAGENGSIPNSGNGGNGLSLYITGIQTYFAGGGGAGSNIAVDANIRRTTGGLGGGGAGGFLDNQTIVEPSQSGLPNTGGGAGGAGRGTLGDPANGGSGIVIVRYPRNSSLDSEPDETRPSLQPYNYARDVRPIISRTGLVLDLDAANPLSYPGTGTTWQDLSGNGNNGTLINGVGYTSQNYGALTFDSSDDYVKINNFGFSNSQITVEFFARIDTTGGRNYAFDTQSDRDPLMKWEDGNTSKIIWGLGSTDYSTYNQGNRVGKFVNYSLTYDGSTERLFINGTQVDSKTGSETINFEELWIGEFNRLGYSMDGLIGNFKVYNRALTQQEIKQNFNATRGRYGI